MQHLSEQLDDELDWSQILSVGEQQRCAFVRALLARPAVLFGAGCGERGALLSVTQTNAAGDDPDQRRPQCLAGTPPLASSGTAKRGSVGASKGDATGMTSQGTQLRQIEREQVIRHLSQYFHIHWHTVDPAPL